MISQQTYVTNSLISFLVKNKNDLNEQLSVYDTDIHVSPLHIDPQQARQDTLFVKYCLPYL